MLLASNCQNVSFAISKIEMKRLATVRKLCGAECFGYYGKG